MKISEFSVKNYQFTIIIFVMVMALGISSLLTMPRGEDPPFNAPYFVVIAVYPGTSPNDMEELVADPIEEKLNELTDIKRIRTEIDDGLMIAQIDFTWGSDIDGKYNEVVREINNIRSSLPADLLSLEVKKLTSSDVNTKQVALISENASYKSLYDEADRLKTALEKVQGVKNVDIHGYPEQQVRISLNLEKMAQNKIPLFRVMAAIKNENVNIPGGSIDMGSKKFNVKTSGDYNSVEEIRNTIVLTSAEKIVYMKDIATVELSYEDESYLARFNGKRAVFVTVSEKDRTNILAINKEITPIMQEFKTTLPANIDFDAGFNQAEDVSKRLSGFARDFGIAIFLVLLTLLPLGWRASIIVMISIPLSLSIGLAMLNFFGYTINQLSIVGLVVALGLLVDDSIVVVENIERFLRNGYSRKDAAIQATKQIGLAVVGCTATLIFAFLPIVFLPEGSGDFIRSLPIAVISTVLASLFVSLTIIPFLSSLLLSRTHNPEGNMFMRGLKKIISGSYRQLLHRALAYPYVTLFIAFGIFVLSIALIPVVGFSLFPKSEKPMFMVNVETPLGTNLYATDSVALFVEHELKQHPQITSFFTNVGKGNPRIYYNIAPKNESSNYAQFFIRTKHLSMTELEEMIDSLRMKFHGYPNAKIEVKQFEQGPPVEAPIAMRIFGENLDTLRALAFKVEDIMKQTDGTIYITNPLLSQKTDLQIAINKDKAGLLGIPVAEIDRTVRLGITGLNIGTYRDEKGDEHQINVVLPKEGKHPSIDQFDKVYVSSVAGNLIPLRQLATIEMNTSVPTIKHYNKNRYITVTSYVKTGYNTGEVTNQIIDQMDALNLPADYSYQAAGEVESSQESFAGLGTIIIITIFGILGILLLEFGTFKSTFIVLSVIPLGVIGAVFTLLLVGKTLSFVAVVGLIALIGIEVKNSILLVDFTNYLRERGVELNKAIEQAGETRFVPIILTTLTAIGGLTPLVLEDAPLYAPLAWVLIGGLISSTLLTRLVTPVLYKLLAPKVEVADEVED